MAKLFAAIDVGSYDLQLYIYQITAKKEIEVIDHIRQPAALGVDTYRNGKISFERLDEVCKILNEFSAALEGYKVSEYRAYATSAVREAVNASIVLDQIRVRTGIDVKVLSNSEQRFLSYKAIASKENEFQSMIQKGTAIAAIGSGGIQISLFDKDALVTTQYINLGALRMRENLARAAEEGRRMDFTRLAEEVISYELDTFKRLFLKEREVKNIIATGTCALYLNRRVLEEREGVQADCISAAELKNFYYEIRYLTTEQIQDKYDIPYEHAFLMVPSLAIYERILELTGAEQVWIPGVCLCDGIVAEYAEEKKLISFHHDFSNDILVASRNIAKRYMCSKKSVAVLEQNALDIFDAMKKVHGMGVRERLLLQIAAILHDCGKYISMRNPAECSYNIIMSTEIIGLSHRERELVANVVRYNTVNFPYESMAALGLRPEENVMLAKLTAILRISNALTQSHRQKFAKEKLNLKDRKLYLTSGSAEDITLELGLFERKADFFEEVYGIRPVLKQRKGAWNNG